MLDAAVQKQAPVVKQVKLKKNINEKQLGVNNIVSCISNRLAVLNKVVSQHFAGCDADLNESTNFCSSKVRRYTAALNGSNFLLRNDEASAIMGSRKTNSAFVSKSAPTLLTDQAAFIYDAALVTYKHTGKTDAGRKLESMFEVKALRDRRAKAISSTTEYKSRLEALKESKYSRKKIETLLHNRMVFERKLQLNQEQYLTRSVHDVILKNELEGDSDVDHWKKAWKLPIPLSPTEMDPELLLQFSCNRLIFPFGRRKICRLSMELESQKISVLMFWLIFCKNFQKNSEQQQTSLLNHISTYYVKILEHGNTLEERGDNIFLCYCFVIAHSILLAFFYLFPASRHVYTSTFKQNVYIDCIHILTGLKLTPFVVSNFLCRAFPDESQDDKCAASNLESLHDVPCNEQEKTLNSSLHLKSTQSKQTMRSSKSDSKVQTKLSISMSILASLNECKKVDGFVEGDASCQIDVLMHSKSKMVLPFNALQLSPLISIILNADELEKSTYRSHGNLKRTIPIDTGDIRREANQRFSSRCSKIDDLLTTVKAARKEYRMESKKSTAKLKERIEGIDKEHAEVSRSSDNKISLMSLAIVEEQQKKLHNSK